MSPGLNPYLTLFRELEGLPEEARSRARKALIWAYSWSVPSPEALRLLASLGPLTELGAGTGYWAWCLRALGADVRAYDRAHASVPCWGPAADAAHGVGPGGPEILADAIHSSRSLLLCWPPLDEPFAQDCLRAFERAGGWRLCWIGPSARTATSAFPQELRDAGFSLRTELPLPSWPDYEDRLTLWERDRSR